MPYHTDEERRRRLRGSYGMSSSSPSTSPLPAGRGSARGTRQYSIDIDVRKGVPSRFNPSGKEYGFTTKPYTGGKIADLAMNATSPSVSPNAGSIRGRRRDPNAGRAYPNVKAYPNVSRGGAATPSLYDVSRDTAPANTVIGNRFSIPQSADKYINEARNVQITPLADRLASYERGISAYQDLNEARKAESLGMSPERYREFKDAKAIEARAATLKLGGMRDQDAMALATKSKEEATSQRRAIADAAAGRQAELEANAPTRQGQQLANLQAQQLLEAYQELGSMDEASDPGGVRRQQIIDMLLTAQGKSGDLEYGTAGGGVDADTGRALPQSIYNKRTGKLVPNQPTLATQANPATPQSDADFDALPVGSYYIDPENGETYRK